MWQKERTERPKFSEKNMTASLGHVSHCLHQEHLAQRKTIQRIKVIHRSNCSSEKKKFTSALVILPLGEKEQYMIQRAQ